MILRKIFNIIVVVFLLSSCGDDFLTPINENLITLEDFYKTKEDFEAGLVATYAPLSAHQLFGRRVFVMNYAMDDRLLHENFGNSALQYNASNEEIDWIFMGLNWGVYRSNLLLEKLTEEIEISDERRESMLGEIYFLRGIYHFYLATWFEVPPLLTSTPNDPETPYPNSTQDEIYNLVESDFKEAIERLPFEMENGRATKGAAMAFLGKTYLYHAKFDSAAAALKNLIDLDIYSLSKPPIGSTDSIDYVNAYLCNFCSTDLPGANNTNFKSEFNSEYIFDVNFSFYNSGQEFSQYLPGHRATGSLLTAYNGFATITGGYGNLAIDGTKFPNEFEKPVNHPAGLEYDPRYYANFIQDGDSLDWRPVYLEYFNNLLGRVTFNAAEDINGTLGTTMGMRKYYYPFHVPVEGDETRVGAPNYDPNNFRLIRYADVLIMYAEAILRSTGNANHPDGLNAINEVRSRVGMPPISTLSKNAIIHERDIEFVGEHIRFWDLARWYRDGWLSLSEVQVFKPTFLPKHTCFPIPISEINKHDGVLKQNPKWE